MRVIIVCCTAALFGAACSQSDSSDGEFPSATTDIAAAENLVANAETEVSPSAEDVAPSHNYATREGPLYGYLGAISPEDQNKGVATPPVVLFRYTGFGDGAHHLLHMGDDGFVLTSNECEVPCVVIKKRDRNGGVISRVGFSTDSIVGAAFQDAMNGKLVRSPAPGAVENGYRFIGGNPGRAENWEPIAPAEPATSDSQIEEATETDKNS